MSFLPRVARLTFRDRVRSRDIWEGLIVEPTFLHVMRSRLRWFQLRCLQDASLGRCFEHVGDLEAGPGSCLGLPWDPPGRYGGGSWGQDDLAPC